MMQSNLDSFFILWQERFQAGHHDVFLLVKQDNQVLGFCRTCDAKQSHNTLSSYGELSHLYLDPEKTARGLGRKLFAFAKSHLRNLNQKGTLLWTLEQNERARKFYEKQGMTTDGARRGNPEALGEGICEARYVLPFSQPT